MENEKTIDVTALGELLIDFTQNGLSEQGNPLFEANPGGAPCNVLSMLTRLGHRTAFIGKVGDDGLGRMLREKSMAQGIDMSGLVMDEEVHTTLAFVLKLANGDRDFVFYRKPGADMMLRADEVDQHKELLENTKIFHFGTLSMTDDGVDMATKEALTIAKDNGALISFDPNFRAPLWKSVDEAKEKMIFGMQNADIMKISDNEIALLTGIDETDMAGIDRGVHELIDRYEIPLVYATLGANGAKAYYKGTEVFQEGFRNPETIETTGAGDTFCACGLHFVLEHGLVNLTRDEIQKALRFANAAASLITTRKGALAVMPTQEEVETYLNQLGC